MRAVVQRVRDCSVLVAGSRVGHISAGLLVYLGVGGGDSEKDVDYLADKVANLRIFEDPEGKMNLSVLEQRGGILVVSQFTLYADARKGRRPSYSDSAPPETARYLYERFLDQIRRLGILPESGSFGASMEVSYTNMGPVTILLDSRKLF